MGFSIGDTVKAVNGPLKGSVGEITSVSGHLAIEVLVAKSPVRAFEGSKTFFRMDQLKVIQKGSRRSASQVIRSLEMRVSRLENKTSSVLSREILDEIVEEAIFNPMGSVDVVSSTPAMGAGMSKEEKNKILQKAYSPNKVDKIEPFRVYLNPEDGITMGYYHNLVLSIPIHQLSSSTQRDLQSIDIFDLGKLSSAGFVNGPVMGQFSALRQEEWKSKLNVSVLGRLRAIDVSSSMVKDERGREPIMRCYIHMYTVFNAI